MKRVLFSPVFSYNNFSGDNVTHYHLGKYLWHVCNIEKKGFQEPIYNGEIHEDVSISFVFFEIQPQHLYFKKPKWIEEFLVVKDEKKITDIARNFDFFMNQYRYRGAHPPETNSGYSADLKEINLNLPATVYKSVFEENLYIDDLLLSDQCAEFLIKIKKKINPEGKPIIALHQKEDDHWHRHQANVPENYDKVLIELENRFPNHAIVLAGSGWQQYQNPKIKFLKDYINEKTCRQFLGHYNSCVQFILSSYFCRDAEISLVAISGFTSFIEMIRPVNLAPPIPVFWTPEVFEGSCTCIKEMKKRANWNCPEFEEYQRKNPTDTAFQKTTLHFLYYSRNPSLLKSYCYDNPNNPEKILEMIDKQKNNKP